MTGAIGFIDTEFNGFGGELISMAIVLDSGYELYLVREISSKCLDPWVAENVIPVLNKAPVSKELFTFSLHTFLLAQKPSKIIADWPSDLEHLFREMMGGNHAETISINFHAVLDTSITFESKIPHNALWDARAIRDCFAVAA